MVLGQGQEDAAHAELGDDGGRARRSGCATSTSCCWRSGSRCELARVFWYAWATLDNGSPNSFDYSGLLQYRPDGTFRAKPALGAFRAVALAAERR